MAKKAVKTTANPPTDKVVAKGKDFGNNVAERAKAIGTRIKSTGTTAKAHVSRNKAAYIADGLGRQAWQQRQESPQGTEKGRRRSKTRLCNIRGNLFFRFSKMACF